MSKIINLTPHVVNVGTLAFKPEPKPARVESVVTEIGSVTTEEGIVHIVETHYGLVEHLPPKTPDVFYIVSRLVKDRLQDRDDVLVPGELNRDESGRITGCKNLSL